MGAFVPGSFQLKETLSMEQPVLPPHNTRDFISFCISVQGESPHCALDNLFQAFVEVGTFILLLSLLLNYSFNKHILSMSCPGIWADGSGREGGRNEEPEC